MTRHARHAASPPHVANPPDAANPPHFVFDGLRHLTIEPARTNTMAPALRTSCGGHMNIHPNTRHDALKPRCERSA